MASQTGYNPVKNSEQDIANLGLDRDFNVPMVEGLVYNPVTDQLDRLVQPGNTLPTQGNNPSYSITKTTVGTVTTTTIVKTINSVAYTKTVVKDTSDGSETVSEWV